MITRTVFLAALTLAGTAQAALHDRGGGLIYDDVLNITWLQDANYAQTSGYDADGRMTWNEAMAWAGQLAYGGYEDWHLPAILPVNGLSYSYDTFSYDGTTDWGFNITSSNSSLAHLFYVSLGNLGVYTPSAELSGCYVSAADTCLDNTGPFLNFQANTYWSGNGHPAGGEGDAWYFNFDDGFQWAGNVSPAFAWAVRDGDVAAIPEPETYGMFLAGLGLIGLMARRKTA